MDYKEREMPNWCENNLTIVSDDKTLLQKIDGAVKEEKLLDFLASEPKNYNDEKAYHWRLDNWGTKWEIDEFTYFRFIKNRIEMGFLSAWAPPLEALKTFKKNHPEVDFIYIHYHEPGCGVCGCKEY